MIERLDEDAFGAGLASVAVIYGVKATAAMAAVWWEAVCHLETAQFQQALRRLMQSEVTTYGRFPAPAALLQHARESAPEIDAESTRAYELVRDNPTSYSPERGDAWDFRGVRDRYGDLVAQSFLAAGGDSAFRYLTERGEPFVRKAFCEAYREGRREQPRPAALLPEPREQRALPPESFAGCRVAPATKPDAGPVLSPAEAGAFLAKLAGKAPAPKPLTHEEWEARRAALLEQAREIGA